MCKKNISSVENTALSIAMGTHYHIFSWKDKKDITAFQTKKKRLILSQESFKFTSPDPCHSLVLLLFLLPH